MFRNLNKCHLNMFRLLATSTASSQFKRGLNTESSENIPLQYIPYKQKYLIQEKNLSEGACLGLAIRKVTEKGVAEEKALQLQKTYTDRFSYFKMLFEDEGCPSRQLFTNEHLRLISNLYIETNELQGKVGEPKIMLQKEPSEGGCSEQSVDFIKKESGSNFENKMTFFLDIQNMCGSNKSHSARFDVQEYKRCTYYDANSGQYTGPCPEVLSIYSEFLSIYKPKEVNVVSIPHFSENENNTAPSLLPI